ncbi:MAG: hypothetical protein A3H44_01485 [Gammaproteobacteria bacterium RIFCSPLOWO2_02_FULL_57_10]|nr:MAG: hypothetical protein A3H44_01485 [Gammaproteobacteria bacterium RIFCSPLOWO2_02_FULL_57_10]
MRRIFKNDLAREIRQWVDEGLVSTAQARDICARYGLDYDNLHDKALGYTVLVALGYFFIGLALITLIGANWNEIPREMRMGGLVALTGATQIFGLQKFRNGNEEGAARIFFLGNLFYGASIILIAQIYHLGEHMADGVFWWALGTLPFTLISPTFLLGLQTLSLALIWLFMEASSGFYPALFPLFIAGSAFVLSRGDRSPLLFLATVLATLFHIEYSLAIWWSNDGRAEFLVEHVLIAIAFCLLAWSVGQWLLQQARERGREYGEVLQQWSLHFFLIFMLIMSFAEPWEELIGAEISRLVAMMLVLLVLLVCWAAAVFLALRIDRVKQVAALIAVNVFILVVVMTDVLAEMSAAAVTLQIFTNLALIAVGVAMILSGVRTGTSRHFFLGIVVILVTAFCRYFSLIGNYVGGAILFIVFATVMLGAARYWRHHQTLANRQEESA